MSKIITEPFLKTPDDKKHLPVLKESDNPTEIHLSGTALTEAGTLTQHKYFDFLKIDLDDYSDISYTVEEAKRIRGHLAKMSTGHTSMVPMICSPQCAFRMRCDFFLMNKAPYGRQCHPSGTLIKTVDHGDVPIEELDPDIHRLISYDRRRTTIRSGYGKDNDGLGVGYSFRKNSRDFNGQLITIKTEDKEHQVTPDHISIVRFNENAVGKFCIYLMRSGDNWRIGKSSVLGRYKKNNRFGHKTFIGFTNRGKRENADAMWLLGIYDTNTEALLAEEYFSCTWSTPKAIFVATDSLKKQKYNGLYKWVTQEQLDQHHDSMKKSADFYSDKLKELGLMIKFPIWRNDNTFEKKYLNAEDSKLLARGPMYMRACNIISEIMDVPTYPEKVFREKRGKKSYQLAHWQKITLTKTKYSGIVYSLGVEKYETYFANDIATHNCLIEINLLREWTTSYIKEYDVDPNSFTEISMINELAEIEIYLWRLSQNLAKPEHAELFEETTVGYTPDGIPLTNKQISTLLEAKEKLYARRARIVKLMVGDRQEKYKKEAALKIHEDSDPSNSMAELRSKLERLHREVKKQDNGPIIDVKAEPVVLSPEDIIGSNDE